MSFRFRHFLVEDSQSTMKVGTDAMLLGSWIDPAAAMSSILDVGTGCGVLALMMAQISKAKIDAIDIDEPSVEEAKYNISQSPWSERIHVFHRGIEEHSHLAGKSYDLILSNPPFFVNSLKPSSSRKSLTKHASVLSPMALLEHSRELMHPDSSLCLILPTREGLSFKALAINAGLFPLRILSVRPVSSKPPHRLLLELKSQRTAYVTENELIILEPSGRFSTDYLSMTQKFHYFKDKKS